jgi:hypothetical protein
MITRHTTISDVSDDCACEQEVFELMAFEDAQDLFVDLLEPSVSCSYFALDIPAIEVRIAGSELLNRGAARFTCELAYSYSPGRCYALGVAESRKGRWLRT